MLVKGTVVEGSRLAYCFYIFVSFITISDSVKLSDLFSVMATAQSGAHGRDGLVQRDSTDGRWTRLTSRIDIW